MLIRSKFKTILCFFIWKYIIGYVIIINHTLLGFYVFEDSVFPIERPHKIQIWIVLDLIFFYFNIML